MQQINEERIKSFLNWFQDCKGSEKSEGQIFFDRLFQAFGHKGVSDSGATCEVPIKKPSGRGVVFADLVWKPRVIIELKKRGTDLQRHYDQAFNYWITLVPYRPKYMVLCNFDEFWIYDLNSQLYDPVHKLKTTELQDRWGGLAFLLPDEEYPPIFDSHHIDITKEAANQVGKIYLSLIERNISKEIAQRFVLQLVIAIFSEKVGLIPQYIVLNILEKSIKAPQKHEKLKDLFFLFKAMAFKNKGEKPLKYQHIPYFNGGIFKKTNENEIEITYEEVALLYNASKENWKKVRPSVFGSIFEGSVDPQKRHSHGIHFTSELDIYKIIRPCIAMPFKEKMQKAKDEKDKKKLLIEVQNFKVLDPACGSGNFLYIAFRELKKLEIEILKSLNEDHSSHIKPQVSPKNFYGIDTNSFGLEIAKVALSIGQKLLTDEFKIKDSSLPFDDLDSNFLPQDALFIQWPKANVIIGNPPFGAKNKIQQDRGVKYVNKIRKNYPDVPGRSDYCIYWFKKAHDHLSNKGMAGLVGTNTIRENYSREGGLDYITQNGGTIIEAVSSQKWSGDAAVHVSIVNWTKNQSYKNKKKKLFISDRYGQETEIHQAKTINSALSIDTDVSSAEILQINKKPKTCFQGQTHGHNGFLLSRKEAEKMIEKNKNLKTVLKPFLTAQDLISEDKALPKRYIIDLSNQTLTQAQKYKELYKIIERKVLPTREKESYKEELRNKKANHSIRVNKHHQNFLNKWWKLSYPRNNLIQKILKMRRYCVCGRVTQRHIFEFIHSAINPNDALVVFTFEDDYSFGILQSQMHWAWFKKRCSTLGTGYRYTSNTVYDTFPWPQNPTFSQVRKVAQKAKELRKIRTQILKQDQISYRDLYKSSELPGNHKLQQYHNALDAAVYSAYGLKEGHDQLEFLLKLNLDLHKKETQEKQITGPGLPSFIQNPSEFITDDCIRLT